MAKYTMEIVSVSAEGAKKVVADFDRPTGLKEELARLTEEAKAINTAEIEAAKVEKRAADLVPERFISRPKKSWSCD